MAPSLSKILAEFNFTAHPKRVDIDLAGSKLGLTLPADYVDFIQTHGTGEGFIGNTYVRLWAPPALVSHNRGYSIHQFLPGFVLFGTNGGGEGFAFRYSPPSKGVFLVPLVGMDMAQPLASSFSQFFRAIFKVDSMFDLLP